MKRGLYLVGYGVTGRMDGCTGHALQVLKEADEVIFRWEKDPIFSEMQASKENVHTVAEFYSRYGPTSAAYMAMAEDVKRKIVAGRSIAFVTPGHPLVCEATSLLLRDYCVKEGIHFEVIPGVSFVDMVTGTLGVDLTEAVQIIAGTDLLNEEVRLALSHKLNLLVCSVYPEPRVPGDRSELDIFLEFLRESYEPERRVRVVSMLPSRKRRIRTDVLETTTGSLGKFETVLKRCRVTYFIDGEIGNVG